MTRLSLDGPTWVEVASRCHAKLKLIAKIIKDLLKMRVHAGLVKTIKVHSRSNINAK